MTRPLPDAVRTRVVDLASEALGGLDAADVPATLRRVAAFAPARRARVAGGPIAGALARDEDFRRAVAEHARERHADLSHALDEGLDVPVADPVDVAALAYLLRPPQWEDLLAGAVTAVEESSDIDDDAEREQLTTRAEAAAAELKQARRRHREQVEGLKEQNADLRRKLGEARGRARAADQRAERAEGGAQAEVAAAESRAAQHEAEVRRLRTRVEQLEAEVAAARRADRYERGSEQLRARLLLDTLLESAQGLRRELALPPVEGAPADAVSAQVAERGSRPSSGQSSLAAGDPALLEQLLALPRAHLVVDGYNVTKTTWPGVSLEQQRERLTTGLAPLVARSGAEVTVVFDAAQASERPLVNRPRGVRVLYSPPGVIADDVIRDLVAAEPRGRPLVVVSSDRAVVADVARAGARCVGAEALGRLLAGR